MKPREEKSKRKQAELLALVGAAIALAFLFLVFLPKLKGEVRVTATEDNTTESDVVGTHPLTGFPLYEKLTSLPQVYGVMIDNHVDAWPQAGLDKAVLVYEAPVEAGISRMLAFFYEGQTVEKIGPIRSARPYFLDWNNELDALYAHVGGSNAALDRIASSGTFDLNQYWFDPFFWRSHNRYAPHNVYTSTQLLQSFVDLKKEQGRDVQPIFETWKFKEPAFVEVAEVERFDVTFYPPSYVVEWKFDPSTNRYLRFQGGSAHTMEDGVQIMADNVAVIVTDVSILDSVGRRKIRTMGEGEGQVFQDGKKKDVVWKKTSESQRVRFYSQDGEEISFNPGVTWVEVIPDLDDLSF